MSELPGGAGWQYEPKWDGFRCIGEKAEGSVTLSSKSGKSLARYFPEVVQFLAAARRQRFVIDGELCIPDQGFLSFEALQLRLHPAASRVARLSQETPAIFIVFDLLSLDGKDIRTSPLSVRRERLEAVFPQLAAAESVRLSPRTASLARARSWLMQAGAGAMDGVIAKRLAEPYQPGERSMLKVKRAQTADCVVGGFRYASNSRQVASLLLGLYNAQGRLDHVGFTSGISARARPAITKHLQGLRGGEGFSGAAPGGPSRWATERSGEWEPVRNELVVEVQYDHVSGGRFRHGTRFLRWRPDKAPAQCTFEQLAGSPRAGLVDRLLKQSPRAAGHTRLRCTGAGAAAGARRRKTLPSA